MPAVEIAPKFVPKVWGSTNLEPWFPNTTEKTGEVWFPADDLLIKFLFTTEHLSVQVHPDDEYAAVHENSRGKTEMWYILRAEPGAQVALGFKEPLTPELFRAACWNGEITDLLAWYDAIPGQTFFTPAGTVHAIGAGLALCEIQQNSDVTYRIYDYGRPRELHIDRSLAVSQTGCHPGTSFPKELAANRQELVRCGHFVTEKIEPDQASDLPGDGYAVILDGAGTIDNQPFRAGTVWKLGPQPAAFIPSGKATLLLTRAV